MFYNVLLFLVMEILFKYIAAGALYGLLMAKTCILFTYLCFILLRDDLNSSGLEQTEH